jgi:hypothetical protein
MKLTAISFAVLLLSGCSYIPNLVILNSTTKDVEICNLGDSLNKCVKIKKGEVGLIGLFTSSTSGYVYSASTEAEKYSYTFVLQSGADYFSSVYCGKVYTHFCDVAVRFDESGIIYWSGATSKHPSPDAAIQPAGFPIKPNV